MKCSVALFRRDRLAVFVAIKSLVSPEHRLPAYRTSGITLWIGIETAPGHSTLRLIPFSRNMSLNMSPCVYGVKIGARTYEVWLWEGDSGIQAIGTAKNWAQPDCAHVYPFLESMSPNTCFRGQNGTLELPILLLTPRFGNTSCWS